MKILKSALKNEIFLVSFLYTLAYGLILFNNGVFLDDWCFYNVAKPAIVAMLNQLGIPGFAHYIIFMLSLPSMIASKVLVFFSFLLSALFLNRILKEIREIDAASRFFIVILYALFPVNFARIALCTSHYSLCVFLFFLGFWLFVKYLQGNNIILRFASLVVFFVSFLTNSVLVFYALLILVFILYKEKSKIDSVRNLFRRLVQYADFLALPLVFWLVKTAFFKPWGTYAGYNHIALRSVVSAPLRSIMAFNESFIAVINSAFSIFLSDICLSIIFGFAVFLLLSKTVAAGEGDRKYDLKLFFLGLIFFFAGVFPYLAAGHMPKLYDWDSRHQLLVPLGGSFTLYYGIRLFSYRLGWRSQARLFLYTLIIALFISVNFLSYLDYQKDWFKQLSLIQHFKSSRIIRDNTTFIFDDQTTDMNAHRRRYRFWEFAGLMKFALKDETRLGIDLDSYNKIDWSRYFVDQSYFITCPEYNISDYKPKDPDFRVVIKSGPYDVSRAYKVIKVLYYKFFKPAKFSEAISGIVKLEYVKM